MTRLTFDTPEGRGFLDATLCRLGDSRPGDILVIRYSGDIFDARPHAEAFRTALMDAADALPLGALKHPLPVVVAREDTLWATIHAVASEEPA